MANPLKYRAQLDTTQANAAAQQLLRNLRGVSGAVKLTQRDLVSFQSDLAQGLRFQTSRVVNDLMRGVGAVKSLRLPAGLTSSSVRIPLSTSRSIFLNQRQTGNVPRIAPELRNEGIAKRFGFGQQALTQFNDFKQRGVDLRRALASSSDPAERDYIERQIRGLARNQPVLQRARNEIAQLYRNARQSAQTRANELTEIARLGQVMDDQTARRLRAFGLQFGNRTEALSSIRRLANINGNQRAYRDRGRELLKNLPDDVRGDVLKSLGGGSRAMGYLTEATEAGLNTSNIVEMAAFRRRRTMERWRESRREATEQSNQASQAEADRRRGIQERWRDSRRMAVDRTELAQENVRRFLGKENFDFLRRTGVGTAQFEQLIRNVRPERLGAVMRPIMERVTRMRATTDEKVLSRLEQSAERGRTLDELAADRQTAVNESRLRGRSRRARMREIGESHLASLEESESRAIRRVLRPRSIGEALESGHEIRSVEEARDYRSQRRRRFMDRADRVAGKASIGIAAAGYFVANAMQRYDDIMQQYAQSAALLEDIVSPISAIGDNPKRSRVIRQQVVAGGIGSMAGQAEYGRAMQLLLSQGSDLNPAETQAIMGEASKLFRLQRADMTTTAKAIDAVRRIAMDDLEGGMGSIRQLANKLTLMADVGGAEIDAVTPYLVNIVGAFKSMGFTLDEALTATAIASKSGMRPELFTTAVRNLPLVLSAGEEKIGQKLLGTDFGEVLTKLSKLSGPQLLEVTGRDPLGSAMFLIQQFKAYRELEAEMKSQTSATSRTDQKIETRAMADPVVFESEMLKRLNIGNELATARKMRDPELREKTIVEAFRKFGQDMEHGNLWQPQILGRFGWAWNSIQDLGDRGANVNYEGSSNRPFLSYDPAVSGLRGATEEMRRDGLMEAADEAEIRFGALFASGEDDYESYKVRGEYTSQKHVDEWKAYQKQYGAKFTRPQLMEFYKLEAQQAGSGHSFFADIAKKQKEGGKVSEKKIAEEYRREKFWKEDARIKAQVHPAYLAEQFNVGQMNEIDATMAGESARLQAFWQNVIGQPMPSYGINGTSITPLQQFRYQAQHGDGNISPEELEKYRQIATSQHGQQLADAADAFLQGESADSLKNLKEMQIKGDATGNDFDFAAAKRRRWLLEQAVAGADLDNNAFVGDDGKVYGLDAIEKIAAAQRLRPNLIGDVFNNTMTPDGTFTGPTSRWKRGDFAWEEMPPEETVPPTDEKEEKKDGDGLIAADITKPIVDAINNLIAAITGQKPVNQNNNQNNQNNQTPPLPNPPPVNNTRPNLNPAANVYQGSSIFTAGGAFSLY